MTVAGLVWAGISPLSAGEALSGEEEGEEGLPGNGTSQGDAFPGGSGDGSIKDYLYKVRNPDTAFVDDLYLDQREMQLLQRVLERLNRLCACVGDGNFSVLGFDEALGIARRQESIGVFSSEELAFIEMLHSRDARDYGFFGTKPVNALTHRIDPADIVKVPSSGNYLFKGDSLEKYGRIRAVLGEDVILTSGIRGIVKQLYLFLNKARRHGGNLSLASRSLAPPGYSYHAVGDFDIGQKGFGVHNFTERFTSTSVYRELIERGYIDNRYWRDNMLGVRYEPWHIKL